MIAPKAQRQAAGIQLTRHVQDFTTDLKAKGRAEKYIYNLEKRLAKVFEGCGWQQIKEVTADSFIIWRAKQRVAPKTLNEYQDACNAFFKWMERVERITHNPLRKVEKVATRGKEVRKRRAFTDAEVNSLLTVAGDHRAAYLTALFTGLRRNELKALEWSDVFLDDPKPYLSARASTTKNKRQATIRLHEQVVAELRAIKPSGSLDSSKVFAGSRLPGMWAFKSDLQRAGIVYADAQGRKADFHAMRYTFATNLSKAGILPREAMELLRHSDMRLTMKTYTDAGLLLTGEAVAKLPSYVTPNGQILVGPMAAVADTQIRTQTPVSGGHKLSHHDTQTPVEFDAEIPQNEGCKSQFGTCWHEGAGWADWLQR